MTETEGCWSHGCHSGCLVRDRRCRTCSEDVDDPLWILVGHVRGSIVKGSLHLIWGRSVNPPGHVHGDVVMPGCRSVVAAVGGALHQALHQAVGRQGCAVAGSPRDRSNNWG